MQKTLLLFFCILICSSCTIQYDGETRIVVQGQLIDKNNKPLSNKKIEIQTYSGDTFVGSDLISYTDTDADGKFTLIFPAPKGDGISIITSINDEYNEFQSKHINALKKNFSNYKLDLNKIVLYENNDITQLDLILNKTSTNKEITEAHIEGLQADIHLDLNADDLENRYLNTHFDVIKNQNVKLSYTIVDYSNTSQTAAKHEAVITINSDKVTHIITY